MVAYFGKWGAPCHSMSTFQANMQCNGSYIDDATIRFHDLDGPNCRAKERALNIQYSQQIWFHLMEMQSNIHSNLKEFHLYPRFQCSTYLCSNAICIMYIMFIERKKHSGCRIAESYFVFLLKHSSMCGIVKEDHQWLVSLPNCYFTNMYVWQ